MPCLVAAYPLREPKYPDGINDDNDQIDVRETCHARFPFTRGLPPVFILHIYLINGACLALGAQYD